MISYERYAELLSKQINRTITDSERNDITNYQSAQPKACPRCGTTVRSYFMPNEIVHDVDKCAIKSPKAV